MKETKKSILEIWQLIDPNYQEFLRSNDDWVNTVHKFRRETRAAVHIPVVDLTVKRFVETGVPKTLPKEENMLLISFDLSVHTEPL